MRATRPTHLVIGVIVATRGIHGEIKVNIETDRPERFYDLADVYIGPEKQRFHVQRARLFKGQGLLQLKGVSSSQQAERLRGKEVCVTLDDAYKLENDEYFVFELEGMEVITEDGERLGELTQVLSTGANDVYIVRGVQGEILLPAIKDVILDINTDTNTMTVHLMPGII